MEQFRLLVKGVAPEGASGALFAPSLAAGVSDSDFPDAVVLWGFEMVSGERVEMMQPPMQMPSDEVLDMLDDEQYEAFMEKYEAQVEAFSAPINLPEGVDVNMWIRSLQEGLEDMDSWEALAPLRDPNDYEWDGTAGSVESIAPYSAAAQVEFELRRLSFS